MPGPYLDEEDLEEQRRREEDDSAPPVTTGAPAPPPATDAPPVAAAPVGGAQPMLGSSPPPMIPLAPVAHPDAPPVTSHARQRLQSLIDQGAPPVQPLHGIKKFGDVMGKIFAPGLEERLRYGAQNDYKRQVGEAEAGVTADKILHPEAAPKVEQWSTVPGMVGPKGQLVQEEKNTGQIRYAPNLEGVHAAKPQNETPQQEVMRDLLTGDNGSPRINPDTQKPYTTKEAFDEAQKQPAPNDKHEDIKDWLEANKLPDTAANREKARDAIAKRAPQAHVSVEGPGGEWQMAEDDKGNTVLYNGKTGETKAAPTNLHPKGAFDKHNEKASADEKRRADLGTNMEENLKAYEDIVRRRPELFGPIAGRMTAVKMAAGSSDPDIGALRVIKEFAGMAAVGTHAMRNAQHAKVAADAMMDLNDDPAAILDPTNGTLARARASIQTFMQPVESQHGDTDKGGEENKGGGDLGPAPAGKAEGSTGTLPDGTKVIVKGGRLRKQ